MDNFIRKVVYNMYVLYLAVAFEYWLNMYNNSVVNIFSN